MKKLYAALLVFGTFTSVFAQSGPLALQGENHLKNIKQLTFGAENAEAYFSFDGKLALIQQEK